MWENHLKKKVRKRRASLLKISLWDSSQFLLVQINPPGWFDQLQMGYSKQLMD